MTAFDSYIEHRPHGQGGETAAPGHGCPDQVDLLVGDSHPVGQVGLAGAQDAHHQTLTMANSPDMMTV